MGKIRKEGGSATNDETILKRSSQPDDRRTGHESGP